MLAAIPNIFSMLRSKYLCQQVKFSLVQLLTSIVIKVFTSEMGIRIVSVIEGQQISYAASKAALLLQ
jgi:hypothetical protein